MKDAENRPSGGTHDDRNRAIVRYPVDSLPTYDAEERRSLIDRRTADRRGSPSALPFSARQEPRPDRRVQERRQGERRRTDVGQATAPENIRLVCPDCGSTLERDATLSWISPGTYSVDTGYCLACSRRFFRTRETGHYDAYCWSPLCRVCREPVSYAPDPTQTDFATYRCSIHPNEEWRYNPRTDQWASQPRRST